MKCLKQRRMDALRHLSNAWKRCFSKVSGVPKFKKKGKDDSFTLDGSITVGFNQIKLPRIGWMKTYEVLPDNVTPKSVTISSASDRWFVSFKVDRVCQITEKPIDVVGVDLGVKTLATLSTGEVFDGAKSYRKLESLL
ncbi:MAG: transposase [Trichodesmium sp. MO_231.B1]|nr:transposase [Trichodesmium sp. MO_231.B1]